MEMIEAGAGLGEMPFKKRWRVGTLSMGVSLISVGLTLFIASWQGVVVFDTLLALWPVIFVLLGCEILLFLFLSRREKPVLHYDVFSIFFVSFLCVCCLLFSLLTSTGLMAEVRHAVNSQVETKDLPNVQLEVPKDVEKIVVQTYNRRLKVDKNSARQLHLMGSYQVDAQSNVTKEIVKPEDIAKIETIGNTMYVLVKELPRNRGVVDNQLTSSMILVIPQEIPVIVRDAYNNEIHE